MALLQDYWSDHFVIEGRILKIHPAVLSVVSGGSFINPITITVASAASAGLNTLETITARRASPSAGFGASILFQLDNSLNVVEDAAAMDAYWEVATSGSVASGIAWRIRDANAALSGGEKMRLTSKGTLALGTTTPNASALFQADSTTRGFAPPRMTATQRNAIGSPLTGLVVYNLTTSKISQYNGTSWEDIGVTGLGAGDEAHFGIDPSIGTTFGTAGLYFRYNLGFYGRNEANSSSVSILTWDLSTATGNSFTIGNITGNMVANYQSGARASSGKHAWKSGSSTIIADLDNVRHGLKVPTYITDGSLADVDAAAILELNTTTKGLLFPRMTTTQRNAISSPPNGLVVYDTTLSKLYVRANSAWVSVGDYSVLVGVAGSNANYAGGTSVTDYESIAGNVIANPNKTMHWVDTTSDRSITLPSAAAVGDIHSFLDISNLAATHPTTFDVQSSGTIYSNSTVIISDNGYLRTFIKIDTSKWAQAK